LSVHAETFQALLSALHIDEYKAAEEYRRLHERLVRLFTLNRVGDPQALADEAMDRLARRIAEECGRIESPSAFLSGIARHLLQEEERRRIRERETVKEWASQLAAKRGTDEELMQRIEECLNRMKPEQQELLRGYYRETGGEKIEHHRQLAAERGVTLNALRNRLMRARRELDECVRRRLSDVSGEGNTKR
jgi:DNA-directed RNA polymerase specialized sigma24 family protein